MRKILEISVSTMYEMSAHAFGLDGIQFYTAVNPNPKKELQISSYQFGGLRRIYTEQLIFSENLADMVKLQLLLKIDNAKKRVASIKSEISHISKDELQSENTAADTNADSDVFAIEAALQKPRSRSFNTSDFNDAFSDLISGVPGKDDNYSGSGSEEFQNPQDKTYMKGFQPIAEEEEDSSNHKESWKDSGKNASKIMGSLIEISQNKSKDNEYQEV